MRNREISFIKSFRFKIVIYSLLSLLMTALTEGIGIFILYQLGVFSRYLRKDSLNHAENFSRNAEFFGVSGGGSLGSEAGNVNESVNGGFGNAAGNNIESDSLGGVAGIDMEQRQLAEGYQSAGFDAEGLAMDRMEGPPGSSFFGLSIDIPDLMVFVFIAFIVGIALFIMYFLVFSRRISNSLAKIAAGIETMAQGDMDTRVQIEGEDEFAVIGEKLNGMAESIGLLIENERKSERIKNNLITNVAHDLRTPLTSVIGYLDLLVKNPDLEEKTKEKYIKIAYDKSLRLQKLIEDLFSFTKVSQGEVEPVLAPLDIVKFMEQMIDEFYPFFQDAGLEYEFLTNKSSIIVMADGDLLARAVSNLMGNAVKYGKDGKNIRIHIKQKDDMVSIAVINYGKVIPEKDLEYIFDRFYRVEGSRSEKTGGSGLGLAIAKRIVVMHDGEIRASSSMEGTTFEIKLKTVTEGY